LLKADHRSIRKFRWRYRENRESARLRRKHY